MVNDQARLLDRVGVLLAAHSDELNQRLVEVDRLVVSLQALLKLLAISL